ncbi:hypothetical protein Sgleb_43990 [Streptomyces glebosus]|uniref:Uncharacterized protein n=1 Tax=Streptomyces glebosus TaxID=249580 RepID=A0A640SZR0_9ACTN|nr:hypothetical protein Sgleb_43990 [Streptomyces glebosus]
MRPARRGMSCGPLSSFGTRTFLSGKYQVLSREESSPTMSSAKPDRARFNEPAEQHRRREASATGTTGQRGCGGGKHYGYLWLRCFTAAQSSQTALGESLRAQ